MHDGAYVFILLFLSQLSFFLWSTLRLFLLFPSAFIFTSLITHICFSVIENECSSQLRQPRLVEFLPDDMGDALSNGMAWGLHFLLEGHPKNAITKAPPVQRVKGSAGLLLVQMHKTKAPTPPRHYTRSQADRSYSTKLREQPIQTFHGRTRG